MSEEMAERIEINETIAKFMGIDFDKPDIEIKQTDSTFIMYKKGEIFYSPYLYTFSLDAMVPVVEKLKLVFNMEFVSATNNWIVGIKAFGNDPWIMTGKFYSGRPAYGLARACAYWIKRLPKKDDGNDAS